MAAIWKTISDDRLTAGRYWLPSVTFDLMARDLGGFEMGFAPEIPTSFHVAGTWTTLCTVSIKFPDSWADDSGLAAHCVIGIRAELYYVVPPCYARLQTTYDTVTYTGAQSQILATGWGTWYILEVTVEDLVIGWLDVNIQSDNSSQVRKQALVDMTVDSYVQIEEA